MLKFSKSRILIGFILLAIIVGVTYDIKRYKEVAKVEVIKEVKVPTEPTGTIVSINIKDLYEDLSIRYNHISVNNRLLIIESIAKTSDKYNISPLVLYSLIAVESSFRWWIDHPLVTVIDSETKKSIKTHAIGLGGIVYEIWGTKLKTEKIIENKSDLYSIQQNIESIAYVYSSLKLMTQHPKASNKIESGLIRYFGGGYKSYFEKIDNEIARIISNKIYKE